MTSGQLNAFSVDVEDYYHVTAFKQDVSKADWPLLPSRVVANTRRLLEIMAAAEQHGTFFVLGWVAEQHPELVSEIAAGGHEVACHGYSHDLVTEQTGNAFRQETHRAKSLLEDIVGRPVIGYRAATFSINERTAWALETLLDLGFRYDSSMFPVHHDLYGAPDVERLPHPRETPAGSILEFPMSYVNLLGQRIPVSGGGYFRLFPYWFTHRCVRRFEAADRPFMFYLHPWEIDVEQPRIATRSLKSRLRHYNNIHRCERRLRRLLKHHRFRPVAEVLGSLGYDLGGAAPAPGSPKLLASSS